MVNRRYIFFMVFIFSIIATSCLDMTNNDIEPIEGNIWVDMYEQLDSTNRTFTLILETEKIYNSTNYLIDYSLKKEDSTLIITLNQIFKNSTYYNEQGPARCLITLNDSSWNFSQFKINWNEVSRKGNLIKNESEYYLKIANGKPLYLKKEELLRVPQNTLWGMLEFDKHTSVAYIDSFFMHLDSLGARPMVYNDGSYNFYQIKNGTIVNPGSIRTQHSDAFIVHFDGDFKDICNWAEYFAYQSKDVHFSISSSNAEHYDITY